MMRILMVAAAILLAGCAGPSMETIGDEQAAQELRNEDGSYDLSQFGVGGDPFLGDPLADVQVVAYDAPGCGNCKAYHDRNLPAIKSDFIDTGRIGYHALQWTVGYTYDITAGVALECAHREGGSEVYFAFLEDVFAKQHSLNLQEALRSIAAEFSLDETTLVTCYEERETRGEVDADIAAGRSSGAGDNPGFAIISPSGIQTMSGTAGPYDLIAAALGDAPA